MACDKTIIAFSLKKARRAIEETDFGMRCGMGSAAVLADPISWELTCNDVEMEENA